jgi:hypothetical protein
VTPGGAKRRSSAAKRKAKRAATKPRLRTADGCEYNVEPVTTPGRDCPDCAAAYQGLTLVHKPTCPFQASLDAVVDADTAWFEAHPGATKYQRPLQPAEAAFIRWESELPIPEGALILGMVEVKLVRPGFRVRDLSNTYWVLP